MGKMKEEYLNILEMFDDGLSADEIAESTGYPVETIYEWLELDDKGVH